MKLIAYLLSLIWRLWFLIIFLIVFVCLMPVLFFFTTVIKNKKTVAYLAKYWSKITLYFSFVFPKIHWEEKLDPNTCYIFCPNHTSTLDIPFIFSIIPNPLQFIGKIELTKIPIFGYFYKKNSVIVDRKNKKNAYSAFLNANTTLSEGLSMCIFPEGGIPKANIYLKKFKNGPFKLALEQNIKIIPITIADNKKMFPKEYFKGFPGIARATVHKAIDPKNISKKSVEDLNKLIYNIIFETLKDYESK